jgi:disulfide oxidoreductase YuzD
MVFSIRRAVLFGAAVCSMLSLPLRAQVNVTTYHNDNSRTGQNLQETILTPANVNSTQFGKLFTVAVDGTVYAQPLVLSNVAIGGGTHNVLYVATEHDSIFAIDADTGTLYWQKSLIPAGGSTVSSSADLNCGDIPTEVGITGTPVIDATTGTLYVVAKVKLNGVISQYLHALDVGTAAEKYAGPVQIQASVAGTASDGTGSLVSFNPRQENQRTALLLENGHVIIAWTSHCDISPWHGWVMSYGETTLTQEGVYNASPDGYGNGIWMSAGGLAADTGGNIYFATGNGSWNATDKGDSVVKLGPPSGGTLPLLDYFTPYDQASLASADIDLSAGGVILLPTLANGAQLLTLVGKDGNIYLVNRNNMGKYCVNQTPACTNSNPQIVQEVVGAFTGVWDVPAYWNGNLYWSGGNKDTGEPEAMKAFSFNANNSGLISTSPTSVTARTFTFSAPVPSISANGTANAILWGVDNGRVETPTCSGNQNCQILYAYDATNLANVLYDSNQAANYRDVPGAPVRFTTPTIANGKVYVGSIGSVEAYGLLNAVAPTASAPTFSPAAGAYTSSQSVTLSDATPNATIYYTTNGSAPTTASAKYSAPVTVGATTTINAIAVASGYGNSAVTAATYTITPVTPPPASGTTPVTLGSAANVTGIYANGSTDTTGGLDGNGDALSATLLGTSITAGGVTFNVGGAGAADAASNSVVALPAGNYTTLNLLATAVNGSQTNQQFVVTYTDGTTSSFTQSLSDWFAPQNFSGESKAVTMAYTLLPNGATRAGPYYLYAYSFAINSAKTVKSVTLPANRNVVLVAATLSGEVTTSPSGPVSVSLSSVANVYGIFNNGVAPTQGGLDTHDYAASASLLGASQTWSGITFSLGAAGAADAASQVTVPLPAGSYSTLNLLAAAVNGSQANQTFVVTYTDGTTTTVTQGISDWFSPQNYPGESRAVSMSYVLTPTGAQRAGAYYFYGYSFALNTAKTVKSLTLPANRNVVLLAATLMGTAATSTAPTAVTLTGVATVRGMFDDGSPVTAGGMDTFGDAYSKTLLGSTLTWSGSAFSLGGAGTADAACAVTVPLPAGSFAAVKLLATAIKGNQANQVFTVTYTDGTTTVITQSLSDWLTPQNYAGEATASTMTYRLTASGAEQSDPVYLYGYSFSINAAKTVQSITLPNTRDVVVLALDLIPAG